MDKLINMKLGTRFLLLTFLLAAVVITVGGVVIDKNQTISIEAHDLSDTQIPVLSRAYKLKLSVVQVQQWLTDISATRGRDGLNDGFDEAENNAKEFRNLIAELSTIDSEHAARYQAMLPIFNNYYAVGKKMAQSYIDEGPAGGNQVMSEFDAVALKISEQVDGFLLGIEVETKQDLSIQNELATSSVQLITGGSLTILFFVSLIYFIMSRALACLPKVVSELKRVAEGDLTSEIVVNRKDEMGELMLGVQSMQHHLKDMISLIGITTSELSTMAEEVSVVMTKTSENIQDQQTETEQIFHAMSEMKIAVNEVAKNVTHTSTATNGANLETEKGQQIVDNAVNGILQLASQIDNTATVISQVERDSENINTVLEVI
ncbi:MAG: methyl-accepting chemotaxis protein, partial [Thiotrichaceae bacterium]|nr:methyl-accepting chemotaxis protein [Thiotrichaceae bacterium]